MKLPFVALGLILGVGTTVASYSDEVKLPDTPAGKQAAGLLRVLAANRESEIREFIEKQFSTSFLEAIPLDRHVEVNRQFADRTGGLVVDKIVSSTELSLVFTAAAKSQRSSWQVAIAVEEAAPHRITRVSFGQPQPWSAIARPPLPDRKMSRDEVREWLGEYLNRLAKADAFSGAVLISRGDDVIFSEAYGLASRAWNAPNRTDTKFNLGSMNKMFTAVAIAQLVERGAVKLDDTIGTHLPNYPNGDVARRVTVRHLLTHTSGLADYFNENFQKTSRAEFRTIADYVPLFADDPLEFEPGSKFRYSNAGFMLLGAIVQAASKQDYFEYVREHIYEPAGMVSTDCYELDRDTPNLATGYTRQGSDGGLRNNVFMHVIRGGPAGGGYSTVEDLHRFAQALRDEKLIQRETLDTWTTPSEQNRQYGLGFEVYDSSGRRVIGHRGGFPGISSLLRIDQNNGYTVAVLSNLDQGAFPVSEALGALAPHMPDTDSAAD